MDMGKASSSSYQSGEQQFLRFTLRLSDNSRYQCELTRIDDLESEAKDSDSFLFLPCSVHGGHWFRCWPIC